MNHWWTRRLQVGLLGIAIILIAMWGCGRERVNPIDSQYEGEGTVALNSPGNIRAQGDIGRIILNWNPVNSTSLAGYGIWRSTSATGSYELLRGESSVPDVTTARTTYVDSTVDVSVSKIYFYKLSSVDVEGQASELSTFVSAEVLDDTRAPAMPTNFVAITDADGKQVTLGWSAPETDVGNQELTGLSGYRIFRIKDSQGKLQIQGAETALIALATELGIDLDNLGEISEDLKDIFVELGTVPAGQTYFLDTDGLEAGVLHVYVVIAVDPDGNIGPPALALVTISAPGANVPVPAGLRATQNEQARIVISWNPVNDPNLLGYLVLRSQSTQGPFTPVTSDTLFTTGQTTYVDSLVATDQVYFYKVQTVVQDPNLGLLHSDPSTFIDGQALADQSAPGAPSDLIVSLDDANFQRVMLSWTAPVTDRNGNELTGLASFEIYRSRDNNTSFALIATVSSDQASFVDTSVELLTTYFYAIRAVDQAGNAGPRSQPISVTTKGFAIPRNVQAAGGEQKITLTWAANTEPELTGYEILRYTDPTHETPDKTFSSVLTTYVDTPVTADQPFVYRVRAVGTANVKSELSAPVSAQATESAPVLAAPRNVQARGGIGHITITWSANTEAELTGYRVMRYTDPAQTVAEATFTTVQTTYVDSPLVAEQTYVYRVQAVGTNNEESETSLYASATVSADQSAPGAPSDLILSLDDANFQRVMLSWTAPTRDSNNNELTGLASFEIYRSRGNNTSFALIATVSSDQASYEDTSVELLTTYFYAVRAVDQSGNAGPRSQSVSVTTKGFAVPRNVQAAGGEQKITLTWAANTEPELTGYEILRYTDPTQETPDQTFSSVLTTYVDTPVTADQPFVYRVRAVGPSNVKSELSAFVSAQATESAPVLAAPRNVQARGGIGHITITWSANTEAELTGYRVLRYTDPAQTEAEATFTTVQTTYVDSPLVAEQTYVYRVQAVGTNNEESELSLYASATVSADQSAPGAPSDLILSLDDANFQRVMLSWTAPTRDSNNNELTGLASFEIYRSRGNNTSFALIATVSSDQASYEDTSVELLTTYFYAVRAVDQAGNAGPRSQSVSVTTKGFAIPRNVQAAGGEQKITLTWAANTEPELVGYEILRYTDPTHETPDKIFSSVLTTYVDTPVTADQPFVYRVRAVGTANVKSELSAPVSAQATESAPVLVAPRNVQARGGINQITITWTANTEAELTGYRVMRYTDPAQTVAKATFTTVQTTYVDSPLVSGQTYVYRVQAVGTNNEKSELSLYASATVATDQSAPGAPSDLIVSLDDANFQRVMLSWTAPTRDSNNNELTGLASFEIYRSRGNNTSFALLTTVSSDQASYEDTSVELLTTYFYAVRAVDQSGNAGPRSQSVSVTTKGFAVPRNVQAAGGEQKITLTWAANTEPELTGYEILRYTDLTQATPDRTFSSILTTYVDTPVTADQPFVYRVRAVGPSNVKSELSAPVSAQALESAPVLAAPRNVQARGGIGHITITWSANTEAELTGYRVMRYTDPAQTEADATFTTVQTTYVDSPLVAEQTYVYRVQAVGTNNEESETSLYASATVATDQSAPGAPSDLILSLDEANFQRVMLSWTAPVTDRNGNELTGLASFEIYRSRDNNASFALIATVSSDRVSYVDSSVELLTTYFYTVRAVDQAGNAGPRSQPVSVTTKGFAIPRNVQAAGGEQKITLTWAANTEPELTGYEILRYTDLTQATPDRTFSSILTTYVDTPVTADQPFVYRVRAVGPSNVKSELSAPVSAQATAPAPVLAAPRNVQAIDGIEYIAITWLANTEAELIGYRVLRYTDPAQTEAEATFTTVQTTYIDAEVVVGRTYVYRVQAIGSNNEESELSLFASAEVLPDNSPPATPSNFEAALASSGTSIELSWDAPTRDRDINILTGLAGFVIYRLEVSSTDASNVALTRIATIDDPTQEMYRDTNLRSQTEYRYRISAIDHRGNESPPSSIKTVTTTDLIVVPPTNLQAEYNDSGPAVVLNWTAPDEFDSFTIQRAVLAAGTSSQALTDADYTTLASAIQSDFYSDTNIQSGTIYVYRVHTNLSGRISVPSDTVLMPVP